MLNSPRPRTELQDPFCHDHQEQFTGALGAQPLGQPRILVAVASSNLHPTSLSHQEPCQKPH